MDGAVHDVLFGLRREQAHGIGGKRRHHVRHDALHDRTLLAIEHRQLLLQSDQFSSPDACETLLEHPRGDDPIHTARAHARDLSLDLPPSCNADTTVCRSPARATEFARAS
ncbi:MAG: hypothetical protein HYU37_03315 [Acidobacteria bacterium]|nr:hypothetical protein [Acidobacteriota bacterium]